MKLTHKKLPKVRIKVPCGEAGVRFETDSKAIVCMGRDTISSEFSLEPTIIDSYSYLVRCVMERDSNDQWKAMEIKIQNARYARCVAGKRVYEIVRKELNESVTRWLSLEDRDLELKLSYANNELLAKIKEESKIKNRQRELATEIETLKQTRCVLLANFMGWVNV